MKYFIYSIVGYANVNKKGQELKDYVIDKYKNCLVPDKQSYQEIIADVKQKTDSLNNKYPRTKKLVLEEYHDGFSVAPVWGHNEYTLLANYHQVEKEYVSLSAKGDNL